MSNRGLGFKYPGDDTRYNDAYTTWLLHMDGPVNSTYMVDNSPKQNGAAAVVNAFVIGDGSSGPGPLHVAATQFNNNAYIYSPVNVDNSFNLALNDFTIDWWEHRVGDVTTYRPSFTWDTIGILYSPMLVGWGDSNGLYFYASNDQASWNIASVLLMGTGWGVVAGKTWARVTAIILGFLDTLFNMLFLAAYPVWATLTIALNVFLIFVLVVHGRETKYTPR